MERLTRDKDEWPCRMAGGCPAESWIINHSGDVDGAICEDCPFEKYINKLAEYEDLEEGV